jgi:uroporphyrinogen III methyltransferase/synthase
VTRAEGQAEAAAAALVARGAEPVVVPAIAIGPPDHPEIADRAIEAHGPGGWVAFTSANGVRTAMERLVRAGRDARAFGDAKFAAVGPATARELARHGLVARVVARELTGEGLADELLARSGGPGRLLLLRAQEARDALPDALRAAGWTVDVAAVYATRAAPDLAERLGRLFAGGAPRLDAAIFTSSSTARHVYAALGPGAAQLLAPLAVVTIGPVTTETARILGIRVDAEASPYTLPAAIAALEGLFAARQEVG